MFLALFTFKYVFFIARYLISSIGVNAGAIGVKGAGFGSILEQRIKVHKNGWNVATFQSRDVPTS